MGRKPNKIKALPRLTMDERIAEINKLREEFKDPNGDIWQEETIAKLLADLEKTGVTHKDAQKIIGDKYIATLDTMNVYAFLPRRKKVKASEQSLLGE